MGASRRIGGILLLFLALALTSTALPTLELEKRTYEKGEQVYLKACAINQSLTVDCLDNEPSSIGWTPSCRYYTFNSANLTCAQPLVRLSSAEQSINAKIFIKNYKQSLLADVTTNTKEDSVSLAKRIRAHLLLGDTVKAANLLGQLKEIRHPKEKCWPADACSLSKTLDTLFHLSQAGLNTSSRVYYDALLWLQAQRHQALNEDWKVTFEASRNETCTLREGTSQIGSKQAGTDKEVQFQLDYDSDKDLNGTCTDDFCMTISNAFAENLYEACADGNETVRFNMPGVCWGLGLTVCSAQTTAKSLLLTGMDPGIAKKAKTWLKKEIARAKIAGKRLSTSTDILSNIYVYNVTRDSDVKTWVFYSQNNEGSFAGDTQVTLEALRVLSSAGGEWIDDAIHWLQETRPQPGWGSLDENMLAYEIFHSDYNYLISQPSFIETGTQTSISLFANRAYNITFNLTGELAGKVALDINHTGKMTLVGMELNTSQEGRYKGALAYNTSTYKGSVPVVLQRNPELHLHFKEMYYLYDDVGEITVPITKSRSALTCSFKFNDLFIDQQADIQSSDNVRFTYQGEGAYTKDVTVNYSCTSALANISSRSSFKVRKLVGPPFVVKPLELDVDGQTELLKITNTLDEELELALGWEYETDYYPVEPIIYLPAESTAYIPVYQKVESPINTSEENTLHLEALDYSQDVQISIVLDSTAERYEQPNSLLSILLALVLFLTLVGGSGVAVLRVYRQKQERDVQNQAALRAKAAARGNHKRKKKADALAKVLMAVDTSLGEKDKEIVKELSDEGYSKRDVKSALKDVKKEQERLEQEREAQDEQEGQEQGKGSEKEKKK